MPDRPILDFLMQFFLHYVDWITQIIHEPSFMLYYDSWWTKMSCQLLDADLEVVDIDFAVLILRTCAFAAQFLPSPTYTIDSIRGMPLGQVRETCNTVAAALSEVAEAAHKRGSLFRIQHLYLHGFYQACDGRLGSSWVLLCSAIRTAYELGYHKPVASESVRDPLEHETKRRIFCNLYVWDG